MPHDQDPSQWEEDIRAFEKQDRKKPPPERPLLFAGSSSIRFWRLKKFFPRHHRSCLNRGFGGSGLPDALHYFDRLVLPYRPRALVLYSGENDLGHGARAEEVLENCHRFLARFRASLPKSRLLLLPIKPSPTLWGKWDDIKIVNAAIAQLAREAGVVDTIDTATPMLGSDHTPRPELYMKDQLHMSTAGYELWTELVTPWVEEQFAAPGRPPLA